MVETQIPRTRTVTVELDDDVLLALQALAAKSDESIGAVLSRLAREALTTRNGVPQFPILPGGGPVTLELVNQLRE